ncbi:uncharacterized protein DUF3886 [Thermolongibacillus altinsuensis]|jgi:hypothetical protein|uniref:Uncharacterized protein DUF3886 n=1 Tax=Thermolongibacillus altinsuensis TaxID=575256 RepID=A0A4R1QJP6_9BACL|nr:DUF3886 domain-containing protein [Thermolongibacillus altinsuensis]TCL53063.1 uncharacterized protein DUF3886 [Thermolongibacillus altinsuensis]GMB07765.1 hypothetical protein B1no1_04750 [Thermolongibacillus altinsuensis]
MLQEMLNENVLKRLKEKQKELEEKEKRQKEEEEARRREEARQREKNKSFAELLEESDLDWRQFK